MTAVSKTPRKTGRPRAMTPAVANKVVDALRKGAPYRLAAAAGGMSADTLARYRDPESPQYDAPFTERCERAREAGFMKLYADLCKAGRSDWRSYRWRLEVGLPELFSRKTAPNATDVRVSVEVALATSAQIRANPARLAALVDAFAGVGADEAAAQALPRSREAAGIE